MMQMMKISVNIKVMNKKKDEDTDIKGIQDVNAHDSSLGWRWVMKTSIVGPWKIEIRVTRGSQTGTASMAVAIPKTQWSGHTKAES